MGDLSTAYMHPTFHLIGYVVEDELWIEIPVIASSEYINIEREGNDEWLRARVPVFWYTYYLHVDDEHIKRYTQTSPSHACNMMGRLPLNKTIKVYYGADNFSVYDYERQGQYLVGKNIVAWPAVWDEEPDYYDDLGDYMAAGRGLWIDLGEFKADGPAPPAGEEPPGWAECRFVDWVLPGGGSGRDWLPIPGDLIGLKFSFHRDDVPARVIVRFNIYNISTWQGECMNYPVDAPMPEATGNGEFFDFTVVDSLGEYEIDTLDFDLYGGVRADVMPPGATDIASVRRFIVSVALDFDAMDDSITRILWLKARDYGAKCIVSPVTGQTWRDLMNLRTTAFGQDVWSVSVPRDDDGQAFTGYNWGDFMADAWEEQMLGLASPSADSAVVAFTPFFYVEDNFLRYSDRDSIPKGRDISGDGFCNWEEYRGFMTVGDQYGIYSDTLHKRLHTYKKEMMVRFMSDLQILPQVPEYIDALPDTMAYLIEHMTPLENVSSSNLSFDRRVSINKIGAYYPYYSSVEYWGREGMNFATTNMPAVKSNQNAVVIFRFRPGQDNANWADPWTTLGRVIPPSFFPITPNEVSKVFIFDHNIDILEDSLQYYQQQMGDSVWQHDRSIVIKKVLAHEIGHTIGMTEQYTDTTNTPYIMGAVASDPDSANRLVVYPPGFKPEYSDSSKKEITIRELE